MRIALAALVAAVAAAVIAVALALAESDKGAPAVSSTKRWLTLTQPDLARSEVGAARIGRFAYVVGGLEQNADSVTAAVERYDIRRDRWTQVRPMPLPLHHCIAAAHAGKLYVSGGYRANQALENTSRALFEYDPKHDRWHRLPSAPSPRAAHALAAIGDRLYAAGGANAGGSLNSLEIYDFKRRRWSRGPSFKGPSRNHTTGAASGGRFYVLAGRDASNYTAVDRYNPRTRRWARMPPLRTARGGIASATLVDGRIVVFGGESLAPGGRTIRPVELFNPRTRRWRSLSGMRTPRHGLGGVALGRRVFAIEGGTQPGRTFAKTIEYLDVR